MEAVPVKAVPVTIVPRRFGETSRRDAWWVEPLLVFLVFGSFVVYATWAAFQNAHYTYGPYLSPFYSPELWGSSHHAVFGPRPDWWPAFVPFSPALLILPFPGLFRFTCYYYRGAYYKAFWADPVSCSVGEPRGPRYRGERSFPLVLQNVHRYFAYIALIFIVILTYDVWLALWWDNPTTGQQQFGIGLGTLLLAVNVVLLACYALGCHSLRHLFGGRFDEVSKTSVSQACYNCSSALNGRHQFFAYVSLFSVAFSDIYVRLCSMGIWSDVRVL
ncbi:MAG: succinate dehydrogenase [Acidimicrobiia bacterium]|nr:succinate dehydrogenase [Acidimicrobiia bacterium]